MPVQHRAMKNAEGRIDTSLTCTDQEEQSLQCSQFEGQIQVWEQAKKVLKKRLALPPQPTASPPLPPNPTPR